MADIIKGTNSYVSDTEADDYMDARPHAAAWTAASADDRAKALIMAAMLLDRHIVWRGVPAVQDQPLAWPRAGLSPIGVDSTAVPVSVRLAQMELALTILGSDPMATPELSGVKRQKVDVIEQEFFEGANTAQVIPDVIFSLVQAYGRRAGGLSSVELLR